jgi:hypothetical protein
MLAAMIPPPPVPRDWFDYMNTAVSFVGLALTVWAVIAARGARAAANDARNAVRRKGASDDFAKLASMAGKLVVAIQSEQAAEARVRASDLASEIPRDRAKFERFLGADSVKLRVIESRLSQLLAQLLAPDPLADAEAIRRATSDAGEISRVLNEISGRLMDRREEEGG